MFGRRPILYSPERVERLVAFTDLLVESAVLKRQRVALVERLRPLIQNPVLSHKVNLVIEDVRALYPDYNISVSLMDDLSQNEFSCSYIPGPEDIPWKKTFCQYTIASGKPFEVSDSFKDLVVCRSPNADKARSYSGVPLIINSWAVGVICIYSDTPREEWTAIDKVRLARWASTIVGFLEIELSQQL